MARSGDEPLDKARGIADYFLTLRTEQHRRCLTAESLIDPVVPFDRVEAYMQMNEHPKIGIKLGVDHSE